MRDAEELSRLKPPSSKPFDRKKSKVQVKQPFPYNAEEQKSDPVSAGMPQYSSGTENRSLSNNPNNVSRGKIEQDTSGDNIQ